MRSTDAAARQTSRLAVVLSAALIAAAASATGTAGAADTTVDQTIVGNPALPFSTLSAGAGDPRTVRQDLTAALPGRQTARTSLIYFGQLTDFQLADEESPARVEFFDAEPLSTFSNSGYRPHEPLVPQAVNSAIQQMNALVKSPVQNAQGFARMANVMLTGDLADSTQRNEVQWVRTLLEGGSLNPNSGESPAGSLCAGLGGQLDNPSAYTGVGDYDDYYESPLFYDPDQPFSQYSAWPRYPGLFNRAQVSFTAPGLKVPSYVAPGNHDVLVQGNEDANIGYEALATNCLKPMAPVPNLGDMGYLALPYLQMLAATSPDKVAQVPPDKNRQYVDKRQYKQVIAAGSQPDDHGFAFVSPAENAASRGSAQYFSWAPKPGMRFIVLDTNSAGSGFLVGPGEEPPPDYSDTSNGNIDDPQWLWLQSQLQSAQAANELVMVFSHHSSQTLDFNLPDELALPCTINDLHGHDVNPGCDADPRLSTPLHLGTELISLFHQYPNVIAHVSGHSHDNVITAQPGPGGAGFWEIRTAAIADWPSQSRVLEVMDNHDGTLSIFGTLLNTAAPIAAPPSGTPAGAFGPNTLASIARTLTYNDPQAGPGGAEGDNNDRNVELLVNDPR